MTLLDHPAGRLWVPLVDAPSGTPIRVRVRGRDVSIAVGEPGNLSIRNRLAATVAGNRRRARLPTSRSGSTSAARR